MRSIDDETIDWDEVLSFPPLWLRDNCSCVDCRDEYSRQKLFKITDLPEHLSVDGIEEFDEHIVVTFQPDGHRSLFPRRWFVDRTIELSGDNRSERSKRIWSADDVQPTVPNAQWSTYCDDPALRLRVLSDVLRLGFATLHDTPTDDRTVLKVAQSFGYVRETNYGELFDVRVEANASNLAFTGAAISPHTDNPYRDPVPTMQLLHCLTNDVKGGDSGLVDGFRAAQILRDEHPKSFATLAYTPVSFAWGDASDALSALRPMIELDPLERIRGVRFNNRSLQTLWLETKEIAEYYDAYRRFARIIERPELMRTFRLESGDCVIFDNTRILHARTEFEETGSGKRHLQGCYADLDGLASAITVLERTLAT